MMNRKHLLPLPLLFLAAAGEAPRLMPTRDATVVFEVTRNKTQGEATKIVVRYDAAANRMRSDDYIFKDAKRPFAGMIQNNDSQILKVISYTSAMAIDRPLNDLGIPLIGLTQGAQFTQTKDTTINGTACTEWAIVQVKRPAWTACITADGTILRASSEEREIMAVSVTYEPLPPDSFALPPDMKQLSLEVEKQGKQSATSAGAARDH